MKVADHRLERLLGFAIEYHGTQRRKYTQQPYWIHLKSVATLTHLFSLGPLSYAIALCHDLLEDTDLKFKSLVLRGFLLNIGYCKDDVDFIFKGVLALTDVFTHEEYPDLNRAQRKALECERLSKIEPEYQSIKVCDLMDNSSSILSMDDSDFASIYEAEAWDLYDVLHSADMRARNTLLGILENKGHIEQIA